MAPAESQKKKKHKMASQRFLNKQQSDNAHDIRIDTQYAKKKNVHTYDIIPYSQDGRTVLARRNTPQDTTYETRDDHDRSTFSFTTVQ